MKRPFQILLLLFSLFSLAAGLRLLGWARSSPASDPRGGDMHAAAPPSTVRLSCAKGAAVALASVVGDDAGPAWAEDQARLRQLLTEISRGLSSLTPQAQRDLLFVDLLSGTVRDDGFAYYFTHLVGDDWLATRAALSRVAPPEYLAAFDCALSAFPGSKPADGWMARQEWLARQGVELELQLRVLDDAWRSAPDLGPVLAAYVRKNPKLFSNAK